MEMNMNSEINLNKLSKQELLNKCKELKVKGYSTKKKEDLIEILTNLIFSNE